jgi:putative ABC transport system permease protein
MPYNGMPADRYIEFDFRDYHLIKNKTPEVEYVSANIYKNSTLSYGQEYAVCNLIGVSQDKVHINNIVIPAGNGRFLDKLDIEQSRKVIVISPEIQKILFKNETPVGKFVAAGNIVFQVIGIYDASDMNSNNLPAYIPFSTAQTLYGKGWGYDRIDFTVNGITSQEASDAFEKRLRRSFSVLHNFNPDDRAALHIRNTAKDAAETQRIFAGIELFIWLIGIASMMAGIVGVGNIMLITVKERTKEIGIRKAIGAKPASVLKIIIFESIIITTIAGYIGMMAGIVLTELIAKAIGGGQRTPNEPTMFLNPTIDLGTIFAATLVLIVAGTAAGLMPAIKAVRVRPIEAMREE